MSVKIWFVAARLALQDYRWTDLADIKLFIDGYAQIHDGTHAQPAAYLDPVFVAIRKFHSLIGIE